MCILIYIGMVSFSLFFYVGLLFRSRRNDLAQSLCQLGFVSSWSINPFIVYSILINNFTKLACPKLKMKLALLVIPRDGINFVQRVWGTMPTAVGQAEHVKKKQSPTRTLFYHQLPTAD